MNRWDIVREKQKDIEKAERHQERRELFKFWYVRQQRTIVALKSIFEVFDKTRTAILNKYREKLLAKRIMRNFNKFSEKYAPTLEDRTCNQIRMVFTASIGYMEDTCKLRAKNAIKDFIKVASMNYDTKTALVDYHEKVTKVQRAWTRVSEDYKLRTVMLSKMCEKESDAMILYCTKQKNKNKKLKVLLKKLQSLDDDVKEKLITFYLLKVKSEHSARVFEWIKHKSNQSGKEWKSEDELQFLVTLVGNMNKFLYKGVDNSILDIEFKKEQKALDKAHKVEAKHGEGGSHGSRPTKVPSSPSKSPSKRPDTSKVAKNKFAYVPLEEQWLEWKYAPGLRFNPSKQDIQIMIKKQTTIKSVDDIELNPMEFLKKMN